MLVPLPRVLLDAATPDHFLLGPSILLVMIPLRPERSRYVLFLFRRVRIARSRRSSISRTAVSAAPAKPHVIVVAGPNGAGKSTAAPYLLRDALEVGEFVNADAIAAGLSAFRPESVAIAAGRIMLARMRRLATTREDFAFETTLASRSFAPWLARLQRSGYHVHLLFLWLRSADLAVSRVAERVRLGGHDVPAAVVRRRYRAGLSNFFRLYLPLADSWQLFDNSEAAGPRPVAAGERNAVHVLGDAETWRTLKESFDE
jgi:predicted ABC-type ATPase